MGEIEVEYEGSKDYPKEKLLELLAEVLKMYKSVSLANDDKETSETPSGAPKKVFPRRDKFQLTVKNIAVKLNLRSGKGLVLAACAYLTFIERKEHCSRETILAAMKTATGIFKKTYGDNLTNYITRLIEKDKLNEVAKDTYALSLGSRQEIEKKLAIS
jgi:hypothetical protein